jgi:hypothetical protein
MPKSFKQFTSSWMERPLTNQLKAILDTPANQNPKQLVTNQTRNQNTSRHNPKLPSQAD